MIRMRPFRYCLALLAALTAGHFTAIPAGAAPQIFSDYREAIVKAKETKSIIAWILVRDFDKVGDQVKQWVREDLIISDKGIVVAHCRTGDSTAMKLFSGKFGQDTSKTPLLVVTTFDGTVLSSAGGAEQEAYQTAMKEGREKGGLGDGTLAVTTSNKDAKMLREVFGKTESGEITMTETRTWTFSNGALVEAALLRASGDTGTLIKKTGEKFDIKFADLAPTDIAYLTKVLGRSPLVK